MIIVDPTQATVKQVNSMTEFVDVYPTLLDLADIPKHRHKLSGNSLKPLLLGTQDSIKEYAVSQMSRGGVQGYSLKTERIRYTVWYSNSPRTKKSLKKCKKVVEELYDYANDPLETTNFASHQEYQEELKRMRKLFLEFFNKERPVL